MNSATREMLEQHFDTAFAAPDGIKKLRELILTLAMQGKLVPQDPRDPPASQLLKEIAAEKKRLVKEGKINAPKPLPEIAAKEILYDIPTGWEWVRFGEIAQHNSGKTLDKGRNTGLPRDYITTSNLYWGSFELGSVRQMLIREEELEKCTVKKDDLLICEGGEAGRAAVWNFETEVCFQNHIHRARLFGSIDPYFAYRFFEKLNATGEIAQHRKGVGISNMSSKALGAISIPLPPLPEQHRIVARIDRLMARCDELERLRAEREQKRRSVHTAALKQLLDAQAADSVADAWQFISRHFGDLYAVKENVIELRKAVLQLAVMGKLVPQNPNDPPASQLLKEIEAEKKRLVNGGKIKAPKPLPKIKTAEMPFVLPPGWEWCRVWDVSQLITSGSRDWAAYYSDSGAIFVTMGNLSRGSYQLRMDTIRYVAPPVTGEGSRTKLEENDLLISITGDVGNLALIPSNFGDAYINQHTCLLRLMPICRSRYFPELMRSPLAKVQFDAPQRGIKNSFRLGDVGEMIIPLPPLPEHHRIVAKIDQLMALCDTLEHQIDAATDKQTELLDALMAPA
ncbi:MAG: restriction endonuclease subunit S [Sulfuritalea sp.]|nr:restriction endonuclease subunit S [Sulfuritalea sp.]